MSKITEFYKEAKGLELTKEQKKENRFTYYDMIGFADAYYSKQLTLNDVVSSFPTKEAMNEKVNKLIIENFEDDEIANRREYAFGFRACYRWIVKDLKHK
tara:strand:+ start:997 stop:1296 length:300 start_codon:yes stop_codon:yes gene_type:complete